MARKKKHPGTIDRHGNAYRVRLQVAKVKHTFRLEGVTLAEAQEFAKKKHGELKEAVPGLRGGVKRMSEGLERFERQYLPAKRPNTQRGYKVSLKALRTFFCDLGPNPPIHTVDTSAFDDYIEWRRTHLPGGKKTPSPASPRTLAKDHAVAHRIFRKFVQWKYTKTNPVSDAEKPKWHRRKPVILSDAELGRLLEGCKDNPMLFTYVMILAEGGLRCESEALWLRFEDVDLDRGFLFVASGRKDGEGEAHLTKTGKSRAVPLTLTLRKQLKDHLSRYGHRTYTGKPSPWLFHHTSGKGGVKAGERRKSFRDALEKMVEKANLPTGFHPHDLRHRRVTTWLAAGGDVTKVKEAMATPT